MSETKPDLMAELAEFARLDAVAIEKSYYDGIGEREDRDEFAINFLRTHHAEIAAAVRDAARYRYLRDGGFNMPETVPAVYESRGDYPVGTGMIHGKQLDAAVDTAMRAGGGVRGERDTNLPACRVG